MFWKKIKIASIAIILTLIIGTGATYLAWIGNKTKPITEKQTSDNRSLKFDIWAINEGVRINPLTGNAFEENSKTTPGGIQGTYKEKNLIWDKATKSISLKGGANEVIGFQLILEGAGEKNIDIRTTNLAGKGESKIPANKMTFFRAFYIYVEQRTDAKRANFPLPAGWYADPLVPLDTPIIGAPFNIDGSNFGGKKPVGIKNQTVWLDLWIPKKTAKGKYKGKISVTSDSGKIDLNINVEVFGFSMPDKNHIDLELMSYHKFANTIPQSERDQFFSLAHQHRATITNTNVYYGYKPELTHKDGKFNWEGFDKAYGPAINGSLYKNGPRSGVPASYFNLPFDPRLKRPDKNLATRGRGWPILNPIKNDGLEVDFTKDYVKKFATLLKDASNHFSKKYPDTKIIVFQDGLDEAAFHKDDKKIAFAHLRSIKTYAEIFQEARLKNVQYKLDIGSGFANNKYDLDGDGKKEGAKDVVDALGASVGLWCINGSRIDLKALAPVIKKGVPVWFYNGYEPRLGPTVIGGEAVGPRTWTWVAWNSDLAGMTIWSFLLGYFEQPWNKPGGKHPGDALYFYPGKNVGAPGKVFVSMRLKAFRRGIQDYEYLYLLTKKDGNKKRARRFSSQVVKNALNIKLEMKSGDDEVQEIVAFKKSKGDKRHWSHNPEDFEIIRYKIGIILGE